MFQHEVDHLNGVGTGLVLGSKKYAKRGLKLHTQPGKHNEMGGERTVLSFEKVSLKMERVNVASHYRTQKASSFFSFYSFSYLVLPFLQIPIKNTLSKGVCL